MNQDEQDKKMSQLIAKCRADEGFKRKLLADPTAVLREHGLEVPVGMQVKIVEDTEKVFHVKLPANPTADELSEDELEQVAGGCVPTEKGPQTFGLEKDKIVAIKVEAGERFP